MASNSSSKSNMTPEQKNALHNFKMETARDFDVPETS